VCLVNKVTEAGYINSFLLVVVLRTIKGIKNEGMLDDCITCVVGTWKEDQQDVFVYYKDIYSNVHISY